MKHKRTPRWRHRPSMKPTSLLCSDTTFPMIPLWRGPLCWMTAIRRRIADSQSDEKAMAATGGGKIRSRRYHIASKPYAKTKQVNREKVFTFKALTEHIIFTMVSLSPSFCYCFVEDISWPAVSARGLHALLACHGDATELASWLRLAKTLGLDRSNRSTTSR